MLLATYVVKFVPQYAGYELGRSHVRELVNWYWFNAAQRNEVLSTTTLATPNVLYGLLAIVVGGAMLITVRLSWVLLESPKWPCGMRFYERAAC